MKRFFNWSHWSQSLWLTEHHRVKIWYGQDIVGSITKRKNCVVSSTVSTPGRLSCILPKDTAGSGSVLSVTTLLYIIRMEHVTGLQLQLSVKKLSYLLSHLQWDYSTQKKPVTKTESLMNHTFILQYEQFIVINIIYLILLNTTGICWLPNSTSMCVLCTTQLCVYFLLHKMGLPVKLEVLFSCCTCAVWVRKL